MWKMIWPKPYQLVILFVAMATILGAIYLYVITSDFFEYSRDFVSRDNRIIKVTGIQHDQQLAFWRGFDFVSGRDGHASLTLRVEADNGKFYVPLELKIRDGRWQMVRAKVVNKKNEEVVIVE
jgi:hypothetical protein